ncbi:MAG: tRNA lysidine(34) synthetase TilS [Pseudolabrys sp.]
MPRQNEPISAAEAGLLFSDLEQIPALVLAVSGGPDSTALMMLAARWRRSLKNKPVMIAVTIDHGLRAEAKREAAAAGRLARKLGLAYRTLRWIGTKPTTGLQQAARAARYRLLGEAARKARAMHILTAHTLDDQAETVLIRMSRGSGVTGLAAMARVSNLPGNRAGQINLVRPLLGVPKSRLIATLQAAQIPFADDPSNRDPRFTRARLRDLMPELAREGLDAGKFSLLAGRLRRTDMAIEAAVDRAEVDLAVRPSMPDAIAFDAQRYFDLPAEIGLRLLGRAVAHVGDEGPVELAKLEALKIALDVAKNAGNALFRRSLAGALVTLGGRQIAVERAPPRRRRALTKRRRGRAKSVKSR